MQVPSSAATSSVDQLFHEFPMRSGSSHSYSGAEPGQPHRRQLASPARLQDFINPHGTAPSSIIASPLASPTDPTTLQTAPGPIPAPPGQPTPTPPTRQDSQPAKATHWILTAQGSHSTISCLRHMHPPQHTRTTPPTPPPPPVRSSSPDHLSHSSRHPQTPTRGPHTAPNPSTPPHGTPSRRARPCSSRRRQECSRSGPLSHTRWLRRAMPSFRHSPRRQHSTPSAAVRRRWTRLPLCMPPSRQRLVRCEHSHRPHTHACRQTDCLSWHACITFS